MIVAEKIFVATLFVFLNLEFLFESSPIIHYIFAFLQIIICWIFIIYFLPRTCGNALLNNNNINYKLLCCFIIYICLICVSYLRSGFYATISMPLAIYNCIYLITFSIFILFYCVRNKDVISLIMASIFLYITINIILSTVGFNSSNIFSTGQASLLRLFGFNINRFTIPLGPPGGSVSFGTISGLLLTISTFAFISKGSKSSRHLCVMLIAIAALLLSDTRGAILSFALTISTYLFLIIFRVTKISILALLIPLLPLIMVFMLYFLYQTEYLDFFVRDQAADITSGRIFIWASGVQELWDFSLIHLVGFGAYGQATSMVSDKYYFLFKDWPSDRPELFSLHSYLLQTIFDLGYFGLISSVLLFKFAFKAAYNLNIEVKAVAVSSLLFLIYSGITDTVPTYYNRESFLVFLVIIGSIIFSFCNDRVLNCNSTKEMK